MKHIISFCPHCHDQDNPTMLTIGGVGEDEIVPGGKASGRVRETCIMCGCVMNENPTVSELGIDGLLCIAGFILEDRDPDGMEYATDEMVQDMKAAEKYYAPGKEAEEHRKKTRETRKKLHL